MQDDSEAPARTVVDPAYDSALQEMEGNAPDVRRAHELLRQAHASGDARATYALGTWYLHG
ncbi:MAG: hypothetical protein JWN27_1675, partial [Candidatus Eremiobacteraeota bacterium]|nr:hypothetical protein [Candidatus Eremiobacteraeota bacterium]